MTMPASDSAPRPGPEIRDRAIFGGCASGSPSSRAFTATAGACSCIPRPAGLSGCATTSTISCSRASASSVGTANWGVPKKTRRKCRDCTCYFCVPVVALVMVVVVAVVFAGAFCGVFGCGSTACPSAPLLGSGERHACRSRSASPRRSSAGASSQADCSGNHAALSRRGSRRKKSRGGGEDRDFAHAGKRVE